MADTPQQAMTKCDIIRQGTKMILPGDPRDMTIPEAIAVLTQQQIAEEEEITLQRVFSVLPWDGALALTKALEERYGWVHTKPPGFFEAPPAIIAIPGPDGQVYSAIWGQFQIRQFEKAVVGCSTEQDSRGMLRFKVYAKAKRKYAGEIGLLFDTIEKIANEQSIYKGQAFNVEVDSDGDICIDQPPTFMDTSMTNPDNLIFSRSLEADLEANLFTPIRKSDECKAHGIPLKRGILLEGPYGCGKSMTAACTAKICRENGWTFINVEQASALPAVIRWSKMFGRVVIFAEDIDRTMSGERDEEHDKLLNIVDGIQGKSDEIILVLTTNHVETIGKAMLRPGRFDAVISISPPDAEAAIRLVRLYAGKALARSSDMRVVGERLAGQIPAVIAEVTKRSKLFAISHARPDDDGEIEIFPDDVILSAESMTRHLALLNGQATEPTEPEKLFSAMKAMVTEALTKKGDEPLTDVVDRMEDKLLEVHRHLI